MITSQHSSSTRMFFIVAFIINMGIVPMIHSSFVQVGGGFSHFSSSFYHNKNSHTLSQKQSSHGHHINDNHDNSSPISNDYYGFDLDASLTSQSSLKRRVFLSTLASTTTATTLLTTTTKHDKAYALSFFGENNGNKPRMTQFSIISNRANSTSAMAMRQPMKEPSYDKELVAESCLLGLLPTKSKEFRTLEKEILKVSVLREEDSPSKDTFQQVNKTVTDALKYLDDQRTKLAPVFNMDDSTVLSIEKATRGEYLLENLRNEISNLLQSVQFEDADDALVCQKRALRALAEVGELLVESFPYDVPTNGKFSFLPRLLGRAKITFLITRPMTKGKGGGNGKNEILGNVTVLADGFAAPITAGNFVDLSVRGFYTGLPVKAMKKRLGAKPTLTLPEDDIVAYDIAITVDKIAGEDSIVQKAIDNVRNKKKDQVASEEEDNATTSPGSILTTMPIMGSFGEGFYDPLTAKPRRIPLEIVQFDRAFGRAKLSYESDFDTSTPAPLPSKIMSVLSPVVERAIQTPTLLTFDIPGLVAMNHPDKNLNGGSSEFFVLTDTNLKPERSSLLNGQYAPFGYVVEGLDIMNKLQAGDMISATYVNEWGKLNLKKIRGTSFADAISQNDDDEDDDE